MQLLIVALVVFIAIVLLANKLRLTKRADGPSVASSFSRKGSILSGAELAFHQVLMSSVGANVVMAKVNMGDVIQASQFRDRGRFSQKHFDWVVCDAVTFAPLLAIELDDSSHSRASAIKRDKVKDEISRAAGLPLLRIPWARDYDREALAQAISTAKSRTGRDAPVREITQRC